LHLTVVGALYANEDRHPRAVQADRPMVTAAAQGIEIGGTGGR
jgi:hypothetical protein